MASDKRPAKSPTAAGATRCIKSWLSWPKRPIPHVDFRGRSSSRRLACQSPIGSITAGQRDRLSTAWRDRIFCVEEDPADASDSLHRRSEFATGIVEPRDKIVVVARSEDQFERGHPRAPDDDKQVREACARAATWRKAGWIQVESRSLGHDRNISIHTSLY